MPPQEENPPSEENDVREAAIVDYDMNELEAKAYRVSLLWIDYSRKIFPDYQHSKMKSGDPRKSFVFKMCHKLVRTTEGLLLEKDYPLYVRAQLDILKHISKNSPSGPLIDPNCLTGDKAWKRWKLWKKKYDAITAKPTEVSLPTGPGEQKALLGFEQTKEFLTKSLGAAPGVEKFRECVTNRNFFRWVNLGKISPYYVVVSPHVKKTVTPEELQKINFDVRVYSPCITEKVMQKFKEMFPHEFE